MLAAFFTVVAVSDAEQVKHARVYHDVPRGLSVAAGEIDLPSQAIWYVKRTAGLPHVKEVYVELPARQLKRSHGDRVQKAEQKREVERGRSTVMRLQWPVIEYAQAHDGKAPVSVADLGDRRRIDTNDVFLLPNIDLGLNTNTPFQVTNPDALLAVELKPYIDDGKHWVVFANGNTERRDIDQELVLKYGLSIRPRKDTAIVPESVEGETATYKVTALLGDDAAGKTTFELFNELTDETLSCTLDLNTASEGSKEDFTEWAKHRAGSLLPYLHGADAPVLNHWLSRFWDVYGQPELPYFPRDRGRTGRRRGQSTTMFSVLGGRAAVRETLQMDALRESKQGEAAIPIDDVQGVAVESHPFEDMLAGLEGGELPLAEFVPHDRFLAYFAKRSALLPFLDKGAEFIAQTGAAYNSNRLNYGLKKRYLARLGISEEWIRFLIEKGLVREVAITMPDLFLIDGTDVTIIVRVSNILLAKPALTMLGITRIGKDIAEHKSESGQGTFWSTRGDVIVFGTNREEVKSVLALHDAKGAGSLGRGAELRYMLNRLPIKEDTRAYFYFSDSFIRRLVGPEVKIGQLRRLRARGEMERLTAAVLHAELDGVKGRPTPASLAELNYASSSLTEGGYTGMALR